MLTTQQLAANRSKGLSITHNEHQPLLLPVEGRQRAGKEGNPLQMFPGSDRNQQQTLHIQMPWPKIPKQVQTIFQKSFTLLTTFVNFTKWPDHCCNSGTKSVPRLWEKNNVNFHLHEEVLPQAGLILAGGFCLCSFKEVLSSPTDGVWASFHLLVHFWGKGPLSEISPWLCKYSPGNKGAWSLLQWILLSLTWPQLMITTTRTTQKNVGRKRACFTPSLGKVDLVFNRSKPSAARQLHSYGWAVHSL